MSCCSQCDCCIASYRIGDDSFALVVCQNVPGEDKSSCGCGNFEQDDLDLSQVFDPGNSATFCFTLPDGEERQFPAQFANGGTGFDGCLEYVVPVGFLDQAGYWCYRIKVSLNGTSWSTPQKVFQVYP